MAKPTLIYYSILKYQSGNLRLLHDNFEVIELPNPDYDTPEILNRADVILEPLGYFCGKEKIDNAPHLKVIGSNTSGHPHIDIDYAHQRNIKVVTLKDEQEFLKNITSTAELTWGLIISLVRNMFPSFKSVLAGNWDRRPFAGRCMLSRMSLGVAGYGRLGKMVASYGKCFDMTVRYYDPFVSAGEFDIERVFSLKELVSTSDVVTIHIPHEPETENLFNSEMFSYFKKGAYFINTSRGELVDHKALLDCLEEGTLAGAALDVFEDEFKPGFTIAEHPLWQYACGHDNLILTPHIGGSTVDAWTMTEEQTIKMILQVLKGGEPQRETTLVDVTTSKDEVWALIPARGGSKSIPLKNVADLNGSPLIDYVIRAGQASSSISRIICSTDNNQIAVYCLSRGIEVQDRPERLAEDNVPTLDVILYFLEEVKEREGRLPQFLVLLEPTSPFVLPHHIDRCVEMLRQDPGADSAQTVTMVDPNSHAYNQRYRNEDGSHFVFRKEHKKYFNKQLKPEFFVHGNVRVMKVVSVLQKRDIFGDRSLPIIIPRIYSLDVDGPEELKLAQSVLDSGLIELPK